MNSGELILRLSYAINLIQVEPLGAGNKDAIKILRSIQSDARRMDGGIVDHTAQLHKAGFIKPAKTEKRGKSAGTGDYRHLYWDSAGKNTKSKKEKPKPKKR